MPKLSEVRLKGVSSLEGIQLVFENCAVSTPFFCREGDSEESGSEQSTQLDYAPRCYKIDPSKTIGAINVTLDRLTLITALGLSYSDNKIAFSHSFDSRGTQRTQSVPTG
mmetsp:Transcript_30673/g.37958  ORF Transcript_30673/g.37958 Transcript_30673/m.37958 type:complete len:110 (+) Transcript_30673:596-925(+)